MPRVLRPGQRFERHRQTWPPGQRLELHEGALELVLFLPRPAASEVQAVCAGDQEVLLVEVPGVLVLATRWASAHEEALGWVVAPLLQARAAPGEPFPDWLRTARSMQLRTVLVDADTGLVHALRVAPLPHPAVRRVAAAVWRQVEEPVADDEADATLAALPGAPDALEALPGARVCRVVVFAGDDDVGLRV